MFEEFLHVYNNLNTAVATTTTACKAARTGKCYRVTQIFGLKWKHTQLLHFELKRNTDQTNEN